MADGLNRATLIGHLGADPELRFTPSNRPVLKFRLATTESYLDQNNTRKEVTHWHNIVLWGPRGEALAKFLSKGSRVYVEGRIENSSYDDKDGVKRYKSEISCTNIIMLGGRAEAGAGAGGGGAPRPSAGGVAPRPAAGGGAPHAPAHGEEEPPDDFGGGGVGGDDDIPF